MTVDESSDLFAAFPQAVRSLKFLSEIGLGYLRLGPPSPAPSRGGGEGGQTAGGAGHRLGSAGGDCPFKTIPYGSLSSRVPAAAPVRLTFGRFPLGQVLGD